jgi:hypothetical protein
MDSLISHIIKNPSWVNVLAFTSLILLGFLVLFTIIEAYNDDQNNSDNKLGIKYIFYFVGIIFFIIAPIRLMMQKYYDYDKIVQNKEYTLTKNNKILTITSKNEFLPSADLEIIYDDDKTIQVKLDDKLYTIDKTSEIINEK